MPLPVLVFRFNVVLARFDSSATPERLNSMPDLEIPAGGGSLLVAWQLKDKRVLIVGGGDVASGRIKSVYVADAYITIIAPRDGLHPVTKFHIENSDRITYHNRVFSGPSDLVGVDMVLTAIDDVEWSRRICDMCRKQRIPVNVADIPPSCDFYFGSQIRKGPLQIMISTNGNGPKLASIVRRRIEDSLPENVGAAIENIGVLRTELRQRAPGVGGDVSKRRMQWMSTVCTTWDLDDLAELDEKTIDYLLTEGWEHDIVPKPLQQKQSPSRTSYVSDGVSATLVGFGVGMALSIALLWQQDIYEEMFTNIIEILRHMFISMFRT